MTSGQGEHKSSNQGRVKDPEHDGRLKDNHSGSSKSSHGQGHVTDPEHDGRLKQNRDK